MLSLPEWIFITEVILVWMEHPAISQILQHCTYAEIERPGSQSLQETKSLGSPLRPSRQHEDMRPIWSMKQVNLRQRILISHHLHWGNLLTLSLPVPPHMMWTFHISPTLTLVTLNLCQGSDVQPRWASCIDLMTPGMELNICLYNRPKMIIFVIGPPKEVNTSMLSLTWNVFQSHKYAWAVSTREHTGAMIALEDGSFIVAVAESSINSFHSIA